MKAHEKWTDDSKGSQLRWYNEYTKDASPSKHNKSEFEAMELKIVGQKALEAETAAHALKESKSKDSELAWMKTALTRGTQSDRIAASVVLLQNNPKYNLSRLVWLVSQVKRGKRVDSRSGTTLLHALRDLFLTELLHPELKLLKFEEHNLDAIPLGQIEKKRLLAHWYFEDQLKSQYEQFVEGLSSIASDTVEANRDKAISIMSDLLIGNGEQEAKLLELLINKIGDPRSKLASKTVFCLHKLLLEHPRMKLVVMRQVEKLLFRKNVTQRTQYYAICLLAQFILEREDAELANSLIDLYFAFFKACLKRGEPDSRMMGAILSGVNRAYPFADIQSLKLDEHIDSVYKLVHLGSFNVSLNALNLLHQLVLGKTRGKQADDNQENRFYVALYRKLMDPRIAVANKRAVFINLLYRVLREDKNLRRLVAFIKRILQVSLYFPASMASAILYVLSQVFKSRSDLQRIMFMEQSSTKLSQKESTNRRKRVKSEKNGERQENSIILSNIKTDDATTDSEIVEETFNEFDKSDETPYDPYCTNPQKSGATSTRPYEVIALAKHFHPSVSLFANTIKERRAIEYTGDPLTDLSLVKFLDRYVFKNPKKRSDTTKRPGDGEATVKSEIRREDPLARRSLYTDAPPTHGPRAVPVQSEAYLNEREASIPVDELFLHRYLVRRRNETNLAPSQDNSDNESVNSEEFNELLDSLGGRGDDFDELDIAGDIASSSTKKIKKKGGDSTDSELDEDDEDDDDLESIDDQDLSDMDFNSEEENDNESEDEEYTARSSTKSKKFGKGDKKRSNVFVAAEEFSEMLEEQARSKHKHGGSNAMSDTDGATSKQLDWEIERNRRIKGVSKRPHKNKHFKVNKRFKPLK